MQARGCEEEVSGVPRMEPGPLTTHGESVCEPSIGVQAQGCVEKSRGCRERRRASVDRNLHRVEFVDLNLGDIRMEPGPLTTKRKERNENHPSECRRRGAKKKSRGCREWSLGL